jgi:hypothetical protein
VPTVLAIFQLPTHAEQAVAELSLNGFTEKDVAMVLFSAVPPSSPGKGGLLGWLQRGGALGDTIDRSDGVGVMDGVSIGAVMAGLLGLSWGSRMRYGPIAVGTVAMLAGGLLGYIVDRLIPEKRRDQYEMARIEGVVMLQISTPLAERAELIKRVLKSRGVKQMAELPDGWAAPPSVAR